MGTSENKKKGQKGGGTAAKLKEYAQKAIQQKQTSGLTLFTCMVVADVSRQVRRGSVSVNVWLLLCAGWSWDHHDRRGESARSLV